MNYEQSEELERELLSAWERVYRRCQGDAEEAAKRKRRCEAGMFRRPMRAWCLAVRASDARLTTDNACAVPEEMVEDREPHTVGLSREGLKEVCGPVWIGWPGVPLTVAAARLGRSREALRRWLPVRPGRRREVRDERGVDVYRHYSDRDAVFDVRYEPGPHFGMKTPVVWVRGGRPLDPGAGRGEGAHAVWGSSWQSLSGQIDEGWEQELLRAPRWRDYPKKERDPDWVRIEEDRAEWDKSFGNHRVQRVVRWKRARHIAMPTEVGTPGVGEGGVERRFRGWDWVCGGRPVVEALGGTG